MSEPKAPHVFDYVEYDLGLARDGNKEERIIWNRIYVLKIEGNVEFRKEQTEKWMDLTLFRAIDITPDHHTHFYLKNTIQTGKKLILTIGRAFYMEPSLTGSVLLMDSAYVVINPAKEDGNLATIKDNQIKKATTPALYNVTCTVANTEYSQALPANTKMFTVKARGGNIKVCFTNGQSGTTYILILDGGAYFEHSLDLASLTLYFQSPTTGAICEIVAWS